MPMNFHCDICFITWMDILLFRSAFWARLENHWKTAKTCLLLTLSLSVIMEKIHRRWNSVDILNSHFIYTCKCMQVDKEVQISSTYFKYAKYVQRTCRNAALARWHSQVANYCKPNTTFLLMPIGLSHSPL